jgi:ABC-type transport system involved in multi-copper enzyme maturation permease subunit
MIRFAWLQSRAQTIAAAILLAAIAIALAVTGPHLVHLYDTTVAGCPASGDCQGATTAFLQNDHLLRTVLNDLLVAVPAIIGLFWGAPLIAGELEGGTFRLAWTQSVTRTRWLAVRLAVVGLASMAVAGLFSLMLTWWSSPLDRALGTPFSSFDYRDLVPVGYAAFAFTLGVTAGVLFRRTLPAMAVALFAFVAVRLSFSNVVRPVLFAPQHQTLPVDAATTAGYGYSGFLPFASGTSSLQPTTPNIPGAWLLSVNYEDKAGRGLTSQFLNNACPGLGGGGRPRGGLNPLSGGSAHQQAPASAQQSLDTCADKVGRTFHEVVSYQPASRYWPLQWYELAIYLAAAVALAGFCVWRIRRHPA